MNSFSSDAAYRGRLAPSPTGLLHLGHASTFLIADARAREANGILMLRNEDLDAQRSRPEFYRAMLEDLHWLGIDWQEGPDVGGPYAPYSQSERREHYLAAWRRLRDTGFLYPCRCSRKDLAQAVSAPQENDDEEPIYPGTCRPSPSSTRKRLCRSGWCELAFPSARWRDDRIQRSPLWPAILRRRTRFWRLYPLAAR